MILIEKIPVGFPVKFATKLLVQTLPIITSATTCQLYYELYEVIENTFEEEILETNNRLAIGNLDLTEEEFTAWDNTMSYIEDLALLKLQLIRKK